MWGFTSRHRTFEFLEAGLYCWYFQAVSQPNRILYLALLLLIAEQITKSFDGVRALKGVSFELAAGEVHALVGENGAGKSTLIKIFTGAVEADSGSLVIGGKHVSKNNPNLARSLGVAAIYQQPSLFPHLTVTENI